MPAPTPAPTPSPPRGGAPNDLGYLWPPPDGARPGPPLPTFQAIPPGFATFPPVSDGGPAAFGGAPELSGTLRPVSARPRRPYAAPDFERGLGEFTTRRLGGGSKCGGVPPQSLRPGWGAPVPRVREAPQQVPHERARAWPDVGPRLEDWKAFLG